MGLRRNRVPSDCETEVRFGSWLGENAKALDRYRRSYSSKTVSGIQFENTFDLEIELKNVILVAFRFFSFLHSQGQNRKSLLHSINSSARGSALAEGTTRSSDLAIF
jgi:hypothetical protein